MLHKCLTGGPSRINLGFCLKLAWCLLGTQSGPSFKSSRSDWFTGSGVLLRDLYLKLPCHLRGVCISLLLNLCSLCLGEIKGTSHPIAGSNYLPPFMGLGSPNRLPRLETAHHSRLPSRTTQLLISSEPTTLAAIPLEIGRSRGGIFEAPLHLFRYAPRLGSKRAYVEA